VNPQKGTMAGEIRRRVAAWRGQHPRTAAGLLGFGGLLLAGSLAYLMAGHEFLLALYQGRSLPVLNGLIAHRSWLTLDYYYAKADTFLLDVWALYLGGLALIVLIEVLRQRSRTAAPEAEAEFAARPGPFFSGGWLVLILLAAALLRLTALGTVPSGLNGDEASSGYDAYSLSQTGRDRFGESWPLFARSFGDYDEACYRYLTIPSIRIFGLNEFSVRLPAALAGLLTVWIFFWLVREWYGPPRALLAALFLAVSPWHIQYSRMGLRAILLPLLFCSGLLFFLKARKQPRWLLVSALLFAGSLYTYGAARMFVPLFLLGLGWLYRRELAAQPRTALPALAILLAAAGFLAMFWITPQGMARAQATLGWNPLKYVINTLTYFSPSFLFLQGGPNLRGSLLHLGQLYRFEALTVLAGLAGLWLQRDRRENKMVWWWLVLYPIPAALTQSGHGLRALIGGPLFALISATGVLVWMDLSPLRRQRLAVLAGALLLLLVSAAAYARAYFRDYPVYSAQAWEYGWREALACARQDPAATVKVSSLAGEANIFVLFYTAYDPEEVQRCQRAVGDVRRFGRYRTGPLADLVRDPEPGLLLLRPEEMPEVERLGRSWTWVRRVLYPDGREALRLLRLI
jgi:4-amino-4-deoxy-L-arabinose transferase-like glycosyltransferase